MKNYYETLEISRYASTDEIKQAVQQRIKLIKTAYSVLADSEKRQAYNVHPTEPNYYALLDADNSATTVRLKLTAEKKLDDLKSIFRILADPQQRQAYDASLDEQQNTPTTTAHVEVENELNSDNPYAAPDTIVMDMSTYADKEMELAPRSSRLYAYLIDSFMYFIPVLPILTIILENESLLSETAQPDVEMSLSFIIILIISIVAIIAIFILNLMYLYQNGQTIGKKILNIKIVRTDYSRASLGRIIILRHFIMGLIGGIPMVGNIILLGNYLMIFRQDRRCVHDHIADTIVVKIH